ncbi:MAG: p-hydroxybenzoate 3-monooxygenase [Actinomycetota bacterium]|jgi:p-hydroxybenzoate 3-monooxygenase|nr:p-hydroxybenzoate 3-monooxygenase [Actinomycetota bacterium]
MGSVARRPIHHDGPVRTQVAIVGAGPAGLALAHLLHLQGIDTVVIETRRREYVEKRVRAGVLEQPTVDLLREVDVGDRLAREGLTHHGTTLRFRNRSHRIDFTGLTGSAITVYGQQEVVRDLITARQEADRPLLFEVDDVRLEGIDGERPQVHLVHQGEPLQIDCDFIAGCDGFHGVSRPTIAEELTTFERFYPFAWLGILAGTRPSSQELVYASHENGFALHSMRSPEVTRQYLQVEPDEDLAQWPDERIWSELRTRLFDEDGFDLEEGEIFEKSITPMRSFVAEPMQSGRLFLVGDAAHIVPPTGAKGMNLAIADACVLSHGLGAFYAEGSREQLASYTQTCLRRVWRAEHFSWFMTSMLHRLNADDPFERKLQLSQLDYVTSSRAAATSLAENYVGLPFPTPWRWKD